MVDYLVRTVEVNNNDPYNIKCSLTVVVKEDCKLPIGLHPMVNIPSEKNKIKIKPGNFDFGLTYPGVVLPGKTLGAIGVIGPIRVNYGRIIPMVDFTAKAISKLFK